MSLFCAAVVVVVVVVELLFWNISLAAITISFSSENIVIQSTTNTVNNTDRLTLRTVIQAMGIENL